MDKEFINELNGSMRVTLRASGMQHLIPYSPWQMENLYHNVQHEQRVARDIFQICDQPSVSLLLAALWHDAVYIPGAGGSANEICSAAALVITAKKLSCYNADVEAAAVLIRQTTVAHHLDDAGSGADTDLNFLLDADLSSLGENDYAAFVKHQHNIILENAGSPVNPEHLRLSATFLSNFLTRNFIYRTDNARRLWEENAIANIKSWMLENGL